MVEGGGSVHDFPLYFIGLVLLLQLPDVGAQSGAVLSLSIFKITIVFVPPLLECPTSEASVMLRTILGGDTAQWAKQWGQKELSEISKKGRFSSYFH